MASRRPLALWRSTRESSNTFPCGERLLLSQNYAVKAEVVVSGMLILIATLRLRSILLGARELGLRRHK